MQRRAICGNNGAQRSLWRSSASLPMWTLAIRMRGRRVLPGRPGLTHWAVAVAWVLPVDVERSAPMVEAWPEGRVGAQGKGWWYTARGACGACRGGLG